MCPWSCDGGRLLADDNTPPICSFSEVGRGPLSVKGVCSACSVVARHQFWGSTPHRSSLLESHWLLREPLGQSSKELPTNSCPTSGPLWLCSRIFNNVDRPPWGNRSSPLLCSGESWPTVSPIRFLKCDSDIRLDSKLQGIHSMLCKWSRWHPSL